MIEEIFKLLFSPAHFGSGQPNGFRVEGPAILVVPAFIAFIGGIIFSFVWVCRDAKKRNKSIFVTLLFILLAGWPASFIWWLWLRPTLKTEKTNV
ncbi:MAG: hypothetical protein PHD76_10425 [Methylacidiphilales bacterium]|nr:hypothetical protein [Candidatus Methylacidiphilales bacterium]